MPTMPGGNFVPQSVLVAGTASPTVGAPAPGVPAAPNIQPQQAAGPAPGGSATLQGVQAAAQAQQGQADPLGAPMAPGQAPGQPPAPDPQAAQAAPPAQMGWQPNDQGQILYPPGQGPVTSLVQKAGRVFEIREPKWGLAGAKPSFSDTPSRLVPLTGAKLGSFDQSKPALLLLANLIKGAGMGCQQVTEMPWTVQGEAAWPRPRGQRNSIRPNEKSSGVFGSIGQMAGGIGQAAGGMAQMAMPGGAPTGMSSMAQGAQRAMGGANSLLGGAPRIGAPTPAAAPTPAPALGGGGFSHIGGLLGKAPGLGKPPSMPAMGSPAPSPMGGMKRGDALNTIMTLGGTMKERLPGAKQRPMPKQPMAPSQSIQQKVAAEQFALACALRSLRCPPELVEDLLKTAAELEPGLLPAVTLFLKHASGLGSLVEHAIPQIVEHTAPEMLGHGLASGVEHAGMGAMPGAAARAQAFAASRAAAGAASHAPGPLGGAAQAAAPAAAQAGMSMPRQFGQAMGRFSQQPMVRDLAGGATRTAIGAGSGAGIGMAADETSEGLGYGRPGFTGIGATLGAGVGAATSPALRSAFPRVLGQESMIGGALDPLAQRGMQAGGAGMVLGMGASAGRNQAEGAMQAKRMQTPNIMGPGGQQVNPEAAAAQQPHPNWNDQGGYNKYMAGGGAAANDGKQTRQPMPTPAEGTHPQGVMDQVTGWWNGLSHTQQLLIGGALLSVLGGGMSGHPGMGLAGGALLGGLGMFGNKIPGMEGIFGNGQPGAAAAAGGGAPQGGQAQQGQPQPGNPQAQAGGSPTMGPQQMGSLLKGLPQKYPWLQQHMGAGDPNVFDQQDAQGLLSDYIGNGQGDPQEIMRVLQDLPPEAKQMLAGKIQKNLPPAAAAYIPGVGASVTQARERGNLLLGALR